MFRCRERELFNGGGVVGGKELKKRKRQKRKHRENQEPCVMRGVYFKNMKWQAAIKVEKKQVHLGTVDSQEEAARLYDRLVLSFQSIRECWFVLRQLLVSLYVRQ